MWYKLPEVKRAYTYFYHDNLGAVVGVTGGRVNPLLSNLLVNMPTNKIKLASEFDGVLEELWHLTPDLNPEMGDASVLTKYKS